MSDPIDPKDGEVTTVSSFDPEEFDAFEHKVLNAAAGERFPETELIRACATVRMLEVSLGDLQIHLNHAHMEMGIARSEREAFSKIFIMALLTMDEEHAEAMQRQLEMAIVEETKKFAEHFDAHAGD